MKTLTTSNSWLSAAIPDQLSPWQNPSCLSCGFNFSCQRQKASWPLCKWLNPKRSNSFFGSNIQVCMNEWQPCTADTAHLLVRGLLRGASKCLEKDQEKRKPSVGFLSGYHQIVELCKTKLCHQLSNTQRWQETKHKHFVSVPNYIFRHFSGTKFVGTFDISANMAKPKLRIIGASWTKSLIDSLGGGMQIFPSTTKANCMGKSLQNPAQYAKQITTSVNNIEPQATYSLPRVSGNFHCSESGSHYQIGRTQCDNGNNFQIVNIKIQGQSED